MSPSNATHLTNSDGTLGASVAPVGWVERSETHRDFLRPMMGFAALNPSYRKPKSHGRIRALLLRPVRQRLSRRAHAQPDRRRLEAGLRRLLQGRRDAYAEVPG